MRSFTEPSTSPPAVRTSPSDPTARNPSLAGATGGTVRFFEGPFPGYWVAATPDFADGLPCVYGVEVERWWLGHLRHLDADVLGSERPLGPPRADAGARLWRARRNQLLVP